MTFAVQLTKYSRRENGGAYCEEAFGENWMVSKLKMTQFREHLTEKNRFISGIARKGGGWGPHPNLLTLFALFQLAPKFVFDQN